MWSRSTATWFTAQPLTPAGNERREGNEGEAVTEETTYRELTLTRTFDASLHQVWDAYTVPEELAKWWGPVIMHTPLDSITIDLRVGGAYNLTMVSDIDGTAYPSAMTILEVRPPELLRLGWDALAPGVGAAEITVQFSEVVGQTVVRHTFAGAISGPMYPMMNQGTDEQLDKLVLLLG
jgi:uncharacterized protein YndB with AHSA1/START domain